MNVSVVIPTHNRVQQVLRAIESLAQLRTEEGSQLETIVVANACTDTTVRDVGRHASRITSRLSVIEEPEAGLNKARNAGMSVATGEVIAFLDDDVWVESSWLTGLVQSFRGGARLVAGKTTLWWERVDRPAWLSASAEKLLTRLDLGDEAVSLVNESPFVGANFAIHREVARAVGNFHPGLDRAGADMLSGGDTEYVRRAIRQGFPAVYSPQMAVRHWVSPERVRKTYLKSVAAGRGREQVALALLAGESALPALALLSTKQLALGIGLGALALLRRDARTAVDAALLTHRGFGCLQAILSPGFRSRFTPGA